MRTLPLLGLPLVLLLGCPDDEGDDGGPAEYCDSCNLDTYVPVLVAEVAIDCGFVRLQEDASAAVACIDAALASDAPFTVRQELQGIDSRVELAFVVDRYGVVQRLFYDSNVCGAVTCEQGCGPTVAITACSRPRVGAMPELALVDCDPGETATLCEPPSV